MAQNIVRLDKGEEEVTQEATRETLHFDDTLRDRKVYYKTTTNRGKR